MITPVQEQLKQRKWTFSSYLVGKLKYLTKEPDWIINAQSKLSFLIKLMVEIILRIKVHIIMHYLITITTNTNAFPSMEVRQSSLRSSNWICMLSAQLPLLCSKVLQKTFVIICAIKALDQRDKTWWKYRKISLFPALKRGQLTITLWDHPVCAAQLSHQMVRDCSLPQMGWYRVATTLM